MSTPKYSSNFVQAPYASCICTVALKPIRALLPKWLCQKRRLNIIISSISFAVGALGISHFIAPHSRFHQSKIHTLSQYRTSSFIGEKVPVWMKIMMSQNGKWPNGNLSCLTVQTPSHLCMSLQGESKEVTFNYGAKKISPQANFSHVLDTGLQLVGTSWMLQLYGLQSTIIMMPAPPPTHPHTFIPSHRVKSQNTAVQNTFLYIWYTICLIKSKSLKVSQNMVLYENCFNKRFCIIHILLPPPHCSAVYIFA